MKNDETAKERLLPLSSMKDYKVAKGNLNVVGWRVVGADGDSLGIVKDLIVDPQVMKVRYLSVVADRRFFNTDTDQYLLVPIGVAALDKSGKKVFVAPIDSRSIANYPLYDGGAIPVDYEYAVRDNFLQSQRDALPATTEQYRTEFDDAIDHNKTGTRRISDDFYNHDTYNENRFYASDQEVQTDKTYTTRSEVVRPDLKDDLYNEERRSTNVEDSITTIERLENLRERGSITEEEFVLLKKRALNL